MVHSVLTSPDSNRCRNQCWKTASWAVKIRDLDSGKISKDFLLSDFRMITILDLVRAKNPQNSATAIPGVTAIAAKPPPSKRVKLDPDDSIHKPRQSLTAPGTPSTSVASVGSTTSCDEQCTRFLMNMFVYDVLGCLKEEISTLS